MICPLNRGPTWRPSASGLSVAPRRSPAAALPLRLAGALRRFPAAAFPPRFAGALRRSPAAAFPPRFAGALPLLLAGALPLLLAGCGEGTGSSGEGLEGVSPSLAPAPTPEMLAWVDETLAGLSLQEKVGQLVTADIYGEYRPDEDADLQRWITLARDHGLGMFVLYGGTPREVAHLLNRLQRESEIPILFSVDFEGGPGQQVRGATEFPANMAFSAVGSAELLYRAAATAAVEGRGMGLHLTYTPVVDISTQPQNPAQSVRSFGGDLDVLGEMVHAYVRGFHENGMLTTAKHFPGRGDIELMPDNAPWTWINKPSQAVEDEDLRAFKIAIDAGVDFVMSEHIAIPNVTEGSELPASVEARLASGWLRDRLGFEGLLTSDDLWYEHVVERFGAEEVAVRAFEAGHDIILKPKDPVATIEALVEAVVSGRIPEARVDEAVRKLLTLKARLNLHRDRFVEESLVGELVGTPAHLALAREVADRSLTLLKNDGVLPLEPGGRERIVNINVQKLQHDPAPPALDSVLSGALPGMRSFTLRPGTGAPVYGPAWAAVGEADLVVLSLFVQRDRNGDATPFRAADLAFLRRVMAAKPGRVVAMAYGNPHLIREIPEVSAFLVGYGEGGWYGNQQVYFDSFVRALIGEMEPSGRLPVYVSDEYPMGSGRGYRGPE
ncbi:MAG: glycoside hydrolase family 3 protein [Longimicrobiales bacterium]